MAIHSAHKHTAKIVGIVPTPRAAGEVIYTQSFGSSSFVSWVAATGTTVVDYPNTNPINFWRDPVYDNAVTSATLSLTELVPGVQYTFSADLALYNAGTGLGWLGVDGIGRSADFNIVYSASGYVSASYTFTATSTNHVMRLNGQASPSSDILAKNVKVANTITGVITYGYESYLSTDYWGSPEPGGDTAVVTGYAHSGAYSMLVQHSGYLGQVSATRTVTGLEVGRSYTFSAWCLDEYRQSFPTVAQVANAKVGVVGIGYGATLAVIPWLAHGQVSYTFTATSTSHDLIIEFTAVTGGGYTSHIVAWDDLLLTGAAFTSMLDLDVPVMDGSIDFDQTREPYIDCDITIPAPEQSVLELITPLSGRRVIVTSTETFGVGTEWNDVARSDVTKVHNLFLVSRELNKAAGELTLRLTSDETLLQLYKHPVSSSERLYGLSVKAAVQFALAKIGATTSRVYQINDTINPAFNAATTGWTFTGWTGTLDTGRLKLVAPSGIVANTIALQETTIKVLDPSKRYATSFTITNGAAAARSWSVAFGIYSTGGTLIRYLQSQAFSIAAGATLTIQTNATPGQLIGGTRYKVMAIAQSTMTAGDITYFDGIFSGQVPEGQPVAAFDGNDSGTNPDYSFSWEGTANASRSIKSYRADDVNLVTKTLDPVVTNLALNPTSALAATYWVGTGASSGSRLTGLSIPQLPGVTTAERFVMSNTTGGWYNNSDVTAPYSLVTGNSQYTVSVWVRPSEAKTVTPSIQWATAAGASLGTLSAAAVTLVPNVWQQVVYTLTAPPTAARAGAFMYSTTAWTAGATYDVTGLMIELGNTAHTYFDGSTLGAKDAGLWAVAWVGTAYASASTLTMLPQSDALIWTPGQSASDWLEPMLQATGLHLWCDESRNWWLRKSTALPELITVASGTGLTSATDSISLDDASDYYDHVVLAFKGNIGATGDPYTTYDTASSGTAYLSGYYKEYDGPQPGTGGASNVLAASLGKGRVLGLTSISNYLTRPGMNLAATIPDATTQTGAIQSVKFSLTDNTMDIKTRGLTTTPANAWVLAPPTRTWNAATGTWVTYTN